MCSGSLSQQVSELIFKPIMYLTPEPMVQPQYHLTSIPQTTGLFQYYDHLWKEG